MPCLPRWTALATAVALSAGCTPVVSQDNDAGTEPPPPPTTLTLTGSFCTTQSLQAQFPVKVLFVMEQSGRMCIADPPGSQASSSFCNQVPVPAGTTVPARVKFLNRNLDRMAQNASASVGLITWEQNGKKSFPSQQSPAAFGSPSDASLRATANGLQLQLGTGADLQGALEMARQLIQSDIDTTRNTNPAILPYTRYKIVLITSGPPSPRCTFADGAMAATAATPWGTWADSNGQFCNSVDPLTDPQYITGFQPGGDRNQNYQLDATLDALRAHADRAHVGKLELETFLISNAETYNACGVACTSLYSDDASTADRVAAAAIQARYLFNELTFRFGGTVHEYVDLAGLTALGNAELDTTPLAAPNVLKGLLVETLSAARSGAELAADSDGDGLADKDEPAGAAAQSIDRDGDGFSDLFESRNSTLGFDPDVADARGCRPTSPLTPGCVARDTDGDGLSQFAEAWFKTREVFADDDADGVPDGLEVKLGLDPAVPSNEDTDADGISDVFEVRLGTNPLVADAPLSSAARYDITWTQKSDANGVRCYDFTLSNLPMTAPAGKAALFKVWARQGPAGIRNDYGVWRAACAQALLDGDTRVPDDLKLGGLDDSYFKAPDALSNPRLNLTPCLVPAGWTQP